MSDDKLSDRVEALGLRGVLEHWEEFGSQALLQRLVEVEEESRGRRGLERRLRNAKLGQFKPFADFDGSWPDKVDHQQLEELFRLDFIEEAANVILLGPNGVGKTMIAKNLAHAAVLKGHTARFITVSEILNDLAAQETGSALQRKLKQYSRWKLLVIDEVGYLAGCSRHADLLFELINRRYEEKSVILTTNKVFSEWGEVFPNSTCVTAMLDRLLHKAEIVMIEGESYRKKEAEEREAEKRSQRKKPRKRRNSRKEPQKGNGESAEPEGGE